METTTVSALYRITMSTIIIVLTIVMAFVLAGTTFANGDDDCDDKVVWTSAGATWDYDDDDCDEDKEWGCAAAARVTIWGTNGNDVIYGTAGNDTISTGPGRDVVYGRGGHDHICLGGGDDKGYGGDGNDTIAGEYGKDRLYGGNGIDTCGVAVPGAGSRHRDYYESCERLVGR